MRILLALFVCILTISSSWTHGQPGSSQKPASAPNTPYDIVVYGDSSGAVTAAISAKREGRSVIWINPTSFAGGMSSSGLGATDFLGYRNTFGGIASEFYDRVAKAYNADYIRSFEPHVGKQVFEQMLADAGVTVVYNELLDRTPGKGVTMDGKRIKSITTLSGKTYRGRMFIDATYVGDLMAAAGVTYTVGREPESQYGEDMAGVRRGDTNPRVHYGQKDKDHFIKEVDPYIKPGDPESGLLPHINNIPDLKNGQGDKKIQAYNYRVCLTTDPANRIPIEKPAGYREIDHELLLRNFDAGDPRLPALVEPLAGPGKKVDWNNMHAVGSDFVGANYDYPEASYERRREIEKEHETYIRGFLWTMANNPRVPEKIRQQTAAYGLPKDEFTDNGGWPWMIYIREARRMQSDYVMTQLDCEGKRKAPDPVGLGSFGMDSHCVQHIVTANGKVQNEGVIWRTPPRPYGISYRALIPRRGECENLFSPICLSASHVAHGSIRMEPVFMALSQSSAIAAGLALDKKISVQDVPYEELLVKLEAAKQIARPEAWKRQPAAKKPAAKQAAPAPLPKATGNLPKAAATKPNIVLIMADDLGYGSLGCYGSKQVKTPHLDRLAASGMRLTDFHSNGALCSPTRAALLTGRYQQRCVEVPDAELTPLFRDQRKENPVQRWAWGISKAEVTLPAMLQQAGYHTALIGKWHLGYDVKFHPMNYGFDEFRGFVGGNVDYHTHVAGYGTKELDWWKDRKIENEEGYTTDLLTKHATEFIARNKVKPFFLYLAHAAVHNPLQGRDPAKKKSPVNTYVEMISSLDDSVGAVMQELRKQQLESNTLVIFCSDNGPAAPGAFAAAGELRGKKGTLFEGGHRVPFIATWPEIIPADSKCDETVMSMDLFPTLAKLAGTPSLAERTIDGSDILPLLKGNAPELSRDLHWQSGDSWAIRRGSWKLMGEHHMPQILINLDADRGETENLLSREPERVEELMKAHANWHKSLGDY